MEWTFPSGTRAATSLVRPGAVLLLSALAIAGCQSYWRKPGADDLAFAADHRDCLGRAGVDVGGDRVLVDLDVYRACLRMHGWKRGTGGGSGRYRGLENEGPVPRDALPEEVARNAPTGTSAAVRPGGPWVVGTWVGAVRMRGVKKDSTRLDFVERGDGIAWTLTREAVIAGRAVRSWASGRVVSVTDDQVDLSGTYDRSEPPQLEGTAFAATLRRNAEGLEGNILGSQQQVLPVKLRRAGPRERR
jgi:hypothetical protein